MKQQYDLLWKIILEPFFYDFLQLVDRDLADTIDKSKKPVFLDKELIRHIPNAQGKFDQRIVDKLVKLYRTSGTEQWILFHLEVQHTYSENFGERMYQYFHGIYQQFKRPVTAYAIFTGTAGSQNNNLFKIAYGGTTLQYTFNAFTIALQDDDSLMRNPNPFALVVLIAKQANLKLIYKNDDAFDQALLANKLLLAGLIFERRLPAEKEKNLLYFLFYYVNFVNKDMITTFEREIQFLTNKNIADMTMQEAILEEKKFEGIREGLEEGIEKGKIQTQEAIVMNMIKMLKLTDDQIINVADVEPGFVSRLRKNVEKIN